MIRKNWLGECCSAASVAVVVLFVLALLVSGLQAQPAQSTIAPLVVRPTSPPAFLAAPSVSLGYSPTSVASGHLTASGNLDLVTADYVAGHISVFRSMGHGSFAPGVVYAAGAQPRSVTIADLNGDGRDDVILANESEGVVSVFAGNGDGTLGARKTYAVGFTPSLVAVGDFSGTGKLDVAVAGASGTTLAILQNDGSGGLKKPSNSALSGIPTALTAADFNHDGHVDLAIAGANGKVSILLGKGNGQFSSLPDIGIGSSAISSIAVGDFNRDGNDDLVVTLAAENQVAVLLGQGDGKFAPAAVFAVGNSPIATQVADVDGDGIADLIVINKGSNTFSVLSGVGDGTFKNALHFVVGNTPLGAATGDLYGNGHIDVATIDQLSRTMTIPVGNGDGTFVAGRAYMAGVQPVSVASGDLNGDGKADLVVANYCATDANCGGSGSAAVLLADAGGVYHVSSTYAMGAGSVSVALVDVNGDKKPDLIALNRVDKTLSIRLGAGDGTFGSLTTIPLSAAPIAVAAGTFIKGGNPGLAVLEDCGSAKCTTPGQVEMLLGSGGGNFQSAGIHTVGYSPVALAVGATRTGGAADVIVANRCGQDASCATGGTASMLLGNGAGAFTPGTDIALGNGPSSIALANLRGSGVLDLVVSRSADNTVAILPGAGDGTFKTAVPYAVGTTPGALAIADFNGDGIPDVAVANTADSTVSVLFGKTDGTLQKSFAVPVSGNATGVAAIAGSTSSAPASLATANGNAATLPSGSNVTVLPNLQHKPLLATGPAPTIAVTNGGPSPSNVNQSVSFTATVTGTGATPTSPTLGAIEFFSDGTGNPISDCGGATGIVVTPGTAPDSTAVCVTSVLTASAAGHSITAQYLGANDLKYNDSATSAAVTQVVNTLAPTISVVPSPASPSAINTSVTFTASLTGVALTPTTPNGTMTFALNGTTVASCTATVSAAGVASCPIQNMTLGANSITATYSGDTNFVAAAPGTAPYTISAQTPSVGMAANPAGASVVNQSVTFTATLTPQTGSSFTPTAPAGTVAFTGGGIIGCTTQPITASGANYVATCATTDLTVGTNVSITATFNPTDTNYNTALGILPHTVNAQTPTVAVTDSPAGTSVLNAPVTFTATLSPAAGSSFTPTAPVGTVGFTAGGTAISTCTLQPISASGANYVATCVNPALNAGNNIPIVATFTPAAGNTDYATATSASLPHTITAITPVVTVTDSPAGTSPLNSSVTFTATLTPPGGDSLTPVVPVGNVGFTANGTAISSCTAQPVSATSPFVATCSTTSIAAGATIPIVATFTPAAGNNNYITATSASLPHTVTKLSGTLGTASSVGASTTVGTSVTFTVTYTVSPVTPIAPATTGTPVTFTINGVASPLCPAVAFGTGTQVATCNTTGLKAGNYVIGAAYAGDTNFNSAAAATINLAVNPAAPTVSLTASSATTPPVVNEPVTFTATVPNPGSGTIIPSGTVTFAQGATTLCANAGLNTATPPVATCAYTFPHPVAAPGTVTATYSGDSNFTAGTAGTTTGTVNTATTAVVIASSGTVSVGQAVTYTTTITGQYLPPPTYPQGTVTFTTNAVPAPTGTCTTPQTVGPTGIVPSCTFVFNTGGPFNVSATYASSNTDFSGNTSNTVIQAVNTGTLGINLTSSASPTSANQPVTFSAGFTPSIPTPLPSGTATYTDNGTTLCAVTISLTGTIPNCPFTFTSAGSHSILVSVPANGAYQLASSNTLTQVVSKNLVATALTPTPITGNVNLQQLFTATLSPSVFAGATGAIAPTGTVTFTVSPSSSGTPPCSNVPLTPPITCNISFPTVGSYTITAVYSGDSNFAFTSGSNSSTPPITTTTAAVTIGGGSTTVGVTPNGSTFDVNQTAISFTATVTPATTGGAIPSGTVTFTDSVLNTDICGQKTLIQDAVNKVATASCAVIFRSAGAHTITASYSGDSNFPPPAGSTVASTGTASATVIADPIGAFTTQSGGTVTANQAVTYTTSLTPHYGGAGATLPAGHVAFTSNPTTSLTGTCMVAGGVLVALDGTIPNCTLIFPAAGTYTVTATFNPSDTNFATISSAVQQSIVKAGDTVVVTPPAVNPVTNQVATFTAAFNPAITGTQPTGTITYKDGATTITGCSGLPVAAGVISPCATAFATAGVGSHSITAIYSGDGNFGGTTSAALTQTVNPAPTAAVVTSSTGTGTTASSAVNQAVTFTATITPQFPGAAPLSAPGGTVTFYDNNNTAAPICSAVSATTAAGGLATATCVYTFTATGTNTVSVSYSGDSNFQGVLQPNSSPVTQTVIKPNLAVDVTPPASAIVNQTVSYTVLITPASKGATTPSGLVTFTDATDPATLFCAPVKVAGDATAGTSSAACQVTFLNAGSHIIKAAYAGDTNFTAGAGTAAAITVTASATTLTLSSSKPAAYATDTVTFTAVVAPTPNLGTNAQGQLLQVPPGMVAFSSADSTALVTAACPNPVAVVAVGNGTSSASCTVTFLHSATPLGQLSVSAAYADTVDSNFSTSSSSAPQTVQDFNVAPSVAPGTGSISVATNGTNPGIIYLTQGSKTSTDLFGAATISTLISTSTAYNPTMNVDCEVYTGTNAAAKLNDPSCVPNTTQPVTVSNNAGAQAFAINATTSAAIGLYTVRITTSDPKGTSPAQYVEIPLYVVSGTSASLSLASGASANEILRFNTAVSGNTADTISGSSYSCPNIWDVTNNKMLNNTAADLAVCSGPATTTAGIYTDIQITIQAGLTTTAQNRSSSSTLYAVTAFGVPILALLGWFGSGKSSRKNLYRFLSLAFLLVGLSYATGCGSSVSKANLPVVNSGLAPGSYLVQVQAKGSSGNTYFAEVPITVVANH